MSGDEREGLPTHSHALLGNATAQPRNDDNRHGRHLKATFLALSGLMVAAVVLALVSVNNDYQAPPRSEDQVAGRPRVEVVEAASRGKAQGVSEKSNTPRLMAARHGGRFPSYDWNDRQLI